MVNLMVLYPILENFKSMEETIIQDLIRIPRPKGSTNLARSGLRKELYSLLLKHYMDGSFPYQGYTVSPIELSELYSIPQPTVEKEIRNGISHNIFSGDVDLVEALQKERSQSLSNILYRIGDSDFRTQRLLRYLGSQVLGAKYPDPLLVKELNASISNQTKLSEVQLKALSQIHQFLQEIPREVIPIGEQEPELTREEILQEIANQPMNLKALEEHIQGTPNLHPIKEKDARNPLAQSLNKEANHSYKTLKDQEKAKPVSAPTIMPK